MPFYFSFNQRTTGSTNEFRGVFQTVEDESFVCVWHKLVSCHKSRLCTNHFLFGNIFTISHTHIHIHFVLFVKIDKTFYPMLYYALTVILAFIRKAFFISLFALYHSHSSFFFGFSFRIFCHFTLGKCLS